MNDPLFFLCTDEYRTYIVSIARKLGSVNAAVYLSELYQRHKYHSKNKELISHSKHGDGWFYYTAAKCEERTALSEEEQRIAYNNLKRLGLIEQGNFGVPCKKHFRLNVQEITEFFQDSKKDSSSRKTPNWKPLNPKLETVEPQTSHIYKENKEDPYKEQQQQEVVVVFSEKTNENNNSNEQVIMSENFQFELECLDDLDLEIGTQQSLFKKYTVEEIEIAVPRVLSWKSRESDTKALYTVLKLGKEGKWVDPEKSETKKDNNKEILETLKHLDGKKIARSTVTVGPTYIEFHSGNSEPKCFKIEDANFKKEVMEHIEFLKALK